MKDNFNNDLNKLINSITKEIAGFKLIGEASKELEDNFKEKKIRWEIGFKILKCVLEKLKTSADIKEKYKDNFDKQESIYINIQNLYKQLASNFNQMIELKKEEISLLKEMAGNED